MDSAKITIGEKIKVNDTEVAILNADMPILIERYTPRGAKTPLYKVTLGILAHKIDFDYNTIPDGAAVEFTTNGYRIKPRTAPIDNDDEEDF